MTSRSLVAALAVTAMAAGACGDGRVSNGEDPAATTTIAGVTLAIPDAWQPRSDDPADGVIASEQWRPPDSEATGLQVVVGCNGGVDDLVEGTLQASRSPLVLTEAVELTPRPVVPGLGAARRLELTFGLGRDDDAQTVIISGLYGEAGGALVLIELTAPVAEHDETLAGDVLESVTADEATLRAACDVGT